MFKKILPTVLLSALVSPVVQAETPVYGVLLSAPTTTYWKALESGLRDGAAEQQADYFLRSINSETAADAKLASCLSMLERKPNVIIVSATEASDLGPCISKAEKLNIPVIALGNTAESFSSEQIGVASVVQTDHQKAVTLGADYIANALGDTATGSVVIAISGASQSEATVAQFTAQLRQHSPDLEVVSLKPEEMINLAPDIKAIVASDSASTHAALQSLQGSTDSDVVIVSLDDETTGPALLESGKIDASVTQLPYLVGQEAITLASKATIASDNTEAVVLVEPILLTKETLQENSEPMLEFIRR